MTIYRYHILLLLLLLPSQLIFSQISQDEFLQVNIAPFNLFDPQTGVLQLGLQKRFSERIAIAADYGLRFNKLSYGSNNGERKAYRYSKSKLEIKYYITSKREKPWVSYFSIQGLYLPQRYRKDSSWIRRGNKSFRYDYSFIKRNVMVSSLLMGKETRKGNITFDKYFGIGLRRITIKHQTSGEREGNIPEPKGFNSPPLDYREGIFYKPHIALGLKIGYIIS